MPTAPFDPIKPRFLSDPVNQFKFPGLFRSITHQLEPTATETWTVEGLNLYLEMEYSQEQFFPIEPARTDLVQAIAQYQLAAEKAGGESAEGKGFLAAKLTLEKELSELGFEPLRAALLEKSPFVVMAFLYVNGSELVWSDQLPFNRERGTHLKFHAQEATRQGVDAFFFERLQTHIQFAPAIEIPSQKKLKLEFQVIGPGPLFEAPNNTEGSVVANTEFIRSINSINYTASTESQRSKNAPTF